MFKRNLKIILLFILTFIFGGLVFLVVQENRGVNLAGMTMGNWLFPNVPVESFEAPEFVPEDIEGSSDDNDPDPVVYSQIPGEGFVFEIDSEPSSVPLEVVSMCGDYPCFNGQEFVDMYNQWEESAGLSYLTKYIYNNKEIDAYIKEKAETRGYQLRPFANESTLVSFENVRTQKSVRDAYLGMRNELADQGIRLHFVSGYRSSVSQRNIFKSKMNLENPEEILTGQHDELLDTVLTKSAIPAYSKHHSGYAVDFGCGNDYLVYEFATTDCYAWMVKNNFENTKKYGFIPSYPTDAINQGPDPEPWEFVWMPVEEIKGHNSILN